MPDYLPRIEGRLRDWVSNFASQVSRNPAGLGLSAADAAKIAAAVATFDAALTRAVEPESRTRAAVLVKNKAKADMLALLRPFSQHIKSDPAIAPQRKAELRLVLGGPAGKISVPDSAPLLAVVASEPHRHVLMYLDKEKSDTRARPAGAAGLQLFCHVGEPGSRPPTDPLEARFVRFLTRQRYALDFKHEQAGKIASYYGRWQSPTGETGPWSQVLSRMISG